MHTKNEEKKKKKEKEKKAFLRLSSWTNIFKQLLWGASKGVINFPFHTSPTVD